MNFELLKEKMAEKGFSSYRMAVYVLHCSPFTLQKRIKAGNSAYWHVGDMERIRRALDLTPAEFCQVFCNDEVNGDGSAETERYHS